MRTPRRRGTAVRTILASALVVTLASLGPGAPGTGSAGSSDADAADLQLASAGALPATPGDFTGYGFDQCEAPNQTAMDAWRRSSPFWGVGIYISGNSRACKRQANLSPTWVSTQLRRGWRLLPITLGPQASCSSRYPKYGWSVDPTINPDPTNWYAAAKRQGRAEAAKAVNAAQSLGIPAGSTLFYDLEAWEYSNRTTALRRCHESALRFVHAWTNKLHALGYESGFYSSAASGIKMLDDVRKAYPNGPFSLPDYLWIARWDLKANTSVDPAYLSPDAWTPHRRVKQYQGGHHETWGGVTINIDRNFLDVGRGSWAPRDVHCDGVKVSYRYYRYLRRGTDRTSQVKALQCLLREAGYWEGGLGGIYSWSLAMTVKRWKADHGFPATATWGHRHWTSLMSQGRRELLKFGSAGEAVHRLERALNATGARIRVNGVFDPATDRALREWQRDVGLRANGIAQRSTWVRLDAGQF